MLAVILAFIIAIAAMILLVCLMVFQKPTVETTIVGNWNVFMFHSPDSPTSFFHESYGYDRAEAESLALYEPNELEDEAASYASFACYMALESLNESTQIVVTNGQFPKFFVFRPDFEQGHLIGVELDTRKPSIDTAVIPS